MNCPRCNTPYECPCGAKRCRKVYAGLPQMWDFDGDNTVCLGCQFTANISWWLDYEFYLIDPIKYYDKDVVSVLLRESRVAA